jgi:hypothetical protein
MRNVKLSHPIAASLAAIIAACGDGGSWSTVACTIGSGTAKTCIEYSIPSACSADAIQVQSDACVGAGGVASTVCSHVGADGGCRVKSTEPDSVQTVTSWLYAGNANNEKMLCTSNGQTWIAP